jgi:hypothetical protein
MMAKADGKNRPLLYGVWGVTSKRTLAICREAKIVKMRKSIYFSIACYRSTSLVSGFEFRVC